MLEMFRAKLRDGMADRAEIIDQRVIVQPELLVDQRGTDDPGIVGELDHLARDGTRDRNACGAGQRPPQGLGEMLPRGLQAGMVGGCLLYTSRCV